LLSKGSSGSLGTFENEYSYRINLDGMSGSGLGNPMMHHAMINGQFNAGQNKPIQKKN